MILADANEMPDDTAFVFADIAVPFTKTFAVTGSPPDPEQAVSPMRIIAKKASRIDLSVFIVVS